MASCDRHQSPPFLVDTIKMDLTPSDKAPPTQLMQKRQCQKNHARVSTHESRRSQVQTRIDNMTGIGNMNLFAPCGKEVKASFRFRHKVIRSKTWWQPARCVGRGLHSVRQSRYRAHSCSLPDAGLSWPSGR